MAPPQNSTLIYDSLEGVDSPLLTMPEDLKRYSPILPLDPEELQATQKQQQPPAQSGANTRRNQIKHNHNTNSNNNNNHNHHSNNNNNNNNNIAIFNDKFTTKLANFDCVPTKSKSKCGHSESSQFSRRSRTISLYGSNSTVDQSGKEITVWLDGEPRYISGVTNKTTCNDIIKALIDDEIRCGNRAYLAVQKDGAASRDYSDYVITECWRGIERSYDGKMSILPVWKAWSRVHNELRLCLKHRNDIEEPPKRKKSKSLFRLIRKYISKLFSHKKKHPAQYSDECMAPNDIKDKTIFDNIKQDIPDEILFVILPDTLYDQSNDNAGNHNKIMQRQSSLEPITEETECATNEKLLKQRLYRLSETRPTTSSNRHTANRSHRRKHHRPKSQRQQRQQQQKQHQLQQQNDHNYLRRRRDQPIRSSVRQKLAQKTTEMNELFKREHVLTKQLTQKCDQYKKHNELYSNPESQLEISIGQIQRNIENYADEIIQTEHELLELKNEIKQDISIINRLKRMTLETNGNECGIPHFQSPAPPPPPLPPLQLPAIKASTVIATPMQSSSSNGAAIDGKFAATTTNTTNSNSNEQQMQFVDNIYEFCDGNASLLV